MVLFISAKALTIPDESTCNLNSDGLAAFWIVNMPTYAATSKFKALGVAVLKLLMSVAKSERVTFKSNLWLIEFKEY